MNRMKSFLSLLSAGVSLVLLSAIAIKSQNFALEKVKSQNLTVASVGLDEQIWQKKADRKLLIQAIEESLNYIKTSKAAEDYHKYPIQGITQDRVRRSLLRFRALLLKTSTPEELQAAVSREFVLYQAVGTDRVL
jgi:membrane-bound lytic murein transglycosylase A